jgi:putative hemolysin
LSGNVMEFVLLCVLVFLSALFSLSETAITAVSRLKIKNMVDQDLRGAKALQRLRDNPSRLLSAVLIGNNVVNIGASSLVTSIIISYMESRGYGRVGYAVAITTGVMTLILLVFGEITPKTIALKRPERLALIAAPYIDNFARVLQPLIHLLTLFSLPLIKLFGASVPDKGPFLSREEIRLMLAVSEKDGEIEEEEREMISSIFEFGSTVAREVITPRPDMICIEVNENLQKAVNLMLESGHSRIPVYEGSHDNILGVVHSKELLKIISGGIQNLTLRDFLRPVLFIPESKKVDELLHQMLAARMHMAVIVDEYGSTRGLITLEDLLEEIVGEIHDEFEKEEKPFDQIDKNIWIVDAKQSIFDVNKTLEVNIPEGEYDTISGFVFSILGKVPVVGDVVKYDGMSISVERIHRRRITRIKIVKSPEIIQEESAAGG